MDSFLAAGWAALWLGILTAISPCPMATNIAAVTFVGRRVGKPRLVIAAGVLYTLGRSLAYLAVAVPLVMGILRISSSANFLQDTFSKALGPLLVLVGLVLMGVIPLPILGSGPGEKLQARAERWGLAGAALLGAAFALAFCPVSAALFFGSLIPLAARGGSAFALPLLYGIGTGLPVLGLAIPMALGARWVSRAYQHLTRFEIWARRLTGAVFVLVGLYESLRNIWGLL